jgi:hypothetical protein
MAHDHGMHHHASPDAEYRETPPGSTYEHTDASIGIIVRFLVWLAVSAVVVHVGLGFIYTALINRSMETGEQRYPLAATQPERLPPAPRLQQFPANELYQFRIGEEGLLRGYGWMNREAGVVHIPIEEAMRLTVERGLLSHAPASAEATPAPGLMPSDSSAGRTLERRRQ